MRAPSLSRFWRSTRRMLGDTAGLTEAVHDLMRSMTPQAAASPAPARPSASPGQGPTKVPGQAPANPGGLEFRLHLPAGLKPGAALVVLLHGCEQEPETLALATGWTALADRLGIVLLMPRQVTANNSHRCFNWYQPGDTTRGQGEVASIVAQLEATLAKYRCDAKRVFVTGISAGGAMAACLLAAYPELFEGGAVVAGLPAGAATGVIGAMTRMAGNGGPVMPASWAARARALGAAPATASWPRLSIWHGLADQVVAPSNAADLAAQWASLCGISGPGDTTTPQPGLRCTAWQDPAGETRIELCEVEGMGHGYPADRHFDDTSTVAPNQVWAAHEILRFWGLIS